MPELAPCPACARHVRHDEAACPFCAAALSPRDEAAHDEGNAGLRLSRRALLLAASAGLSGCATAALYGGPPPSAPDPATATIYGGPPPPADAGPSPSPERDAGSIPPEVLQPVDQPMYGAPPKP